MTEVVARKRPMTLQDERGLFESWLDFQRATFLAKCEGLSAEQLRARPVPTSLLSLHGMIRHLAETERNWFARILPNEPNVPGIWRSAGVEGFPFLALESEVWTDDVETWRAECDASRASAAAYPLEHLGRFRDKDIPLRSIYHHMHQEYARHNGHADIIRELIDGTTGF
jgi:uncharacterized damage-inducible protein DinB